MSPAFKIVLVTVSLLIAVGTTPLIGIGTLSALAWGSSGMYVILGGLITILGPITLGIYIAFLRTKKDVYFYLMLASMVIYALFYLFGLNS